VPDLPTWALTILFLFVFFWSRRPLIHSVATMMNSMVVLLLAVACLLALAFASEERTVNRKISRPEDGAKERGRAVLNLESEARGGSVRELWSHTDNSQPTRSQWQDQDPRRRPPGPHYDSPPVCPPDQKPKPHMVMAKTTRSPTRKPRQPEAMQPKVAMPSPKSKAAKSGVERPTRRPSRRPRRPRRPGTPGGTRPRARPRPRPRS
jgi:hypothetical protein